MSESELCEFFNRHLAYDQEHGSLLWKLSRYKCVAGSVAGSLKKDGYRAVSISGKFYLTHRIIWLMQTGSWPKNMIDHVNGDRADNRWCNLREANHTINMQNQRPLVRSNLVGVMGVVARRGKYIATLGHNKKQVYLGTFNNPEDAGEAYLKAKRELHQGCTI